MCLFMLLLDTGSHLIVILMPIYVRSRTKEEETPIYYSGIYTYKSIMLKHLEEATLSW
jgi:hypothetical protein